MRGKVLFALAILGLFWGTEARANDVAYAYCPSGEGYIFLYDAPGSFNVVAYLKCGEKLEVLSAPSGSVVNVRTADGKQGYVQESSLTAVSPAPAQQSQPEPAPAPKTVNPPPQPAAQAFTPFSNFGFGPNVPRLEIFGGYSFMNAGTSGLANRENVNGFESSATYNITRLIGAEGNFGGYYKTLDIVGVGTFGFHDYLILGGPRFNIRKAFFHGLAGVDHLSGSSNFYQLGATTSDNALAAAVGGGVEWNVSRQMALRTSADYVLSRFEGFTQSNVRVTVGVVFQKGSVNDRRIEVGQK